MFRWITIAILQSAALLAQSTASVQGTIIDAVSKKALSGAYVTAIRVGLPPASQTTISSADGSFQIQSLPPGNYSLCVQLPGGGHLNPCEWEGIVPVIALAAGQTSAGNTLQLKPGATVKVRFQDAAQNLSQKTKQGYDPDLIVGVGGPRGLFRPLHQAGKDNAGADFDLTVPSDLTLTLSVSSKSLTLADDKGGALPGNAGHQDFQCGSADPQPKQFVFTITGKVP
jgi:hypothetical protein